MHMHLSLYVLYNVMHYIFSSIIATFCYLFQVTTKVMHYFLIYLQPENYSFHFWCERAFIFAKNNFFILKTNKQAQLRREKVMHSALLSIKSN